MKSNDFSKTVTDQGSKASEESGTNWMLILPAHGRNAGLDASQKQNRLGCYLGCAKRSGKQPSPWCLSRA